MATDSSSGTLPSSSRLTIVSSSSIARSKESFLTSSWVFSAILRSRMRSLQLEHDLFGKPVPTFPDHALPGTESSEFLRAYCGGVSRAHQCGDVRGDRFFQPLQVVAALQHRHNPAAGAGLRDIHQLARDPAEILRPQIERGQRIAIM